MNNRTWIALIVVAIISVGVVIGWDVVMTTLGYKSSFNYNVTAISPNLYFGLEDHLLENNPNLPEIETPDTTDNTTVDIETSF